MGRWNSWRDFRPYSRYRVLLANDGLMVTFVTQLIRFNDYKTYRTLQIFPRRNHHFGLVRRPS
jgi:hypothetical protein